MILLHHRRALQQTGREIIVSRLLYARRQSLRGHRPTAFDTGFQNVDAGLAVVHVVLLALVAAGFTRIGTDTGQFGVELGLTTHKPGVE